MWGNKPKEAQYKQHKISLYPQPRNIAKMSDVGETKTETALKKSKEIVQNCFFPPEEIQRQVKNPQMFLEVGRVWHIPIAAKKQVEDWLNVTSYSSLKSCIVLTPWLLTLCLAVRNDFGEALAYTGWECCCPELAAPHTEQLQPDRARHCSPTHQEQGQDCPAGT